MVESKDRIISLEERNRDLATMLQRVASNATLPAELQAQVEDLLSEVSQFIIRVS